MKSEVSDWMNQIISDIPEMENKLMAEAKRCGTYTRALKWLKTVGPELPGIYSATAQEYASQLKRIMAEEVARKLLQEAKSQPIKEEKDA